MMLISAALNVRLWTLESPINYTANGGYFSWPLIWFLEKGLKTNSESYITAIKAIIIVLLLGLIIYLLYMLNVRLPKLPTITIEQPDRPQKKTQKSDAKEEERPTITITRPDISTEAIMEKVSQATGVISKKTSNSGSLFKEMFKTKVVEKIEEKKPRPVIQYAGDKPTFGYSVLESNLGNEQKIDEKFLVEKTQALQTKLAEF